MAHNEQLFSILFSFRVWPWSLFTTYNSNAAQKTELWIFLLSFYIVCYSSIYILPFQHFVNGLGKRSGTCRGRFIISWSRMSQKLEESFEQGEYPPCLSQSSQCCYEMERIQSQPFNGQQSRLGCQPVYWPPIPWPNDGCIQCLV